MPVIKMGFEGELFYGAAGATGTNRLRHARDITESFDVQEGDTTSRGDGTAPPIEYSRVTARKYTIEFNHSVKSDDTNLTAMIAAAVAGNPVALRGTAFATGLGPDGDFILKFKRGKPLRGEQTLDFTATPNNDNRELSLNV